MGQRFYEIYGGVEFSMENAQIVASMVEYRGVWATVARGGAGSGRGGERVRLDPPVHSANFFLLMILFQGKGCSALLAAGPSSDFLSS